MFGLKLPGDSDKGNRITGELIDLILQLRMEAKANRDFETADRIRDLLGNLGVMVKDRKDGADWEIN